MEIPRPELSGVLVLRVWIDHEGPDGLRARLTQVVGLGDQTVATAATPDDIYAAVRSWLGELIALPADTHPEVTLEPDGQIVGAGREST